MHQGVTLDTEPSPATHEATALPSTPAPSLYAVAVTVTLPSDISPMDVDQPVGSPAHRCATPPHGNRSPATAPIKATPQSTTTPAQTGTIQGTNPTPPIATQPAPTAHPPAHPWLLRLLLVAALPLVLPLNLWLQPHLPPQILPNKLTTPSLPMPSPRPRGALNPPSPNLLDNQQPLLNPPAASVPDPKLKDPVSQINKFYYDLVFTIKARGDLEAMAIQRLYLTEFLAAICQVDESMSPQSSSPLNPILPSTKRSCPNQTRLDNPTHP